MKESHLKLQNCSSSKLGKDLFFDDNNISRDLVPLTKSLYKSKREV